ncbi:SDR family oxidoreductase [Sphingomonas flavalba]|uniref:SDR family oxidoreductase n=1 Tax=Sphingomonas flavalba TaxID=2559804 RepID=UPI00109DFE44|nr:SDR family oxidoreductase [Sphingomonas flavalba]
MIALAGRVAIVSGATQGLGADIARRLHGAGASVVLLGRGVAEGEAVAAELGEGALFVRTDLTSDADIAAAVAAAIARFGHVDTLINNACIYADAGLDSTREQWLATLNVNLVGAAMLTRAAMAHLPDGRGVIVNITSVGGRYGAAGRALYPASKAALAQFTRNAAATLAPRGIRVLSVTPAWTWSPALAARAGNEARADRVAARLHPLGRAGRGGDVADAVVFACSDMAGFITGTDIAVDGGFTMLGPDQGRSPAAWFEETGFEEAGE